MQKKMGIQSCFKCKFMTMMVVGYCALLLMVWIYEIPTLITDNLQLSLKTTDFFVNTTGCFIPYTYAFDPSIQSYITNYHRVTCPKKLDFTYQFEYTIVINTASSDMLNFSHCEYQVITRDKNSDSKIYYSSWKKFSPPFNISDNFLGVKCFKKNAKTHFYKNYHAFVLPNATLEKKLDKRLESHRTKVKEPMNVVMIGIDSVSRLNHIRTMPKTRKFLLNILDAIDLHGYNKVADNTYVNIVPMTTGNYVHQELKRSGTGKTGPFDKFNIIWKNFSQAGYVTMLTEDAPNIAIFNYLKKGFARQPTDYYFRTMSKAMEKDVLSHHCVQNRSETKVLLDYTYDFLKTYKDRPTFGFTFISRLTHDHLNHPASVDVDYHNMLEKSYEHGLFNNSILFFFGDHGFRFGSFQRTEIGKLESRMPMMYIAFPKWFHKVYPSLIRNFRKNTRRLTTPFDIYETLKDILYFSEHIKNNTSIKNRGISLFEHIPEERTCDDAEINPQWCVCKQKFATLNMTSPIAKITVEFVIQQINSRIHHLKRCAVRKLAEIISIKMYMYKDTSEVRINFVLSPENATFESIVKYDAKTNETKLISDITRTNRYGHTADCIDEAKLRNFCYCLSLPVKSNHTTVQSKTPATKIPTTTVLSNLNTNKTKKPV